METSETIVAAHKENEFMNSIFQIVGNDSSWRRKQLSKLLHQRVSEEGPLVKNLEIHITLPDHTIHINLQ
uniref:Uncharacterized protein n=1 Tax=Magallana gigas TaxID=29159 RepID=A0A8W8M9E8_MAGGI